MVSTYIACPIFFAAYVFVFVNDTIYKCLTMFYELIIE